MWKWKKEKVAQSGLTLCDPLIQSMEFSRQEYWSGLPCPPPGDLPNPGIKPRSLTLQVDSLPAEPQGKPKNTGVGSHSLLQWIFLTQKLNLGLLHCRQILYQLSYQGSPIQVLSFPKRTSGETTVTAGIWYKGFLISGLRGNLYHKPILSEIKI